MSFHQIRRQQFLSEDFYQKNVDSFNQSMPAYLDVLHAKGSDANDRRRVSAAIAADAFENFLLKYSAGELLESLRAELESIVEYFEQSARYEREFENEPRFPPLRFSELAQYERVMQLISLCYLLHRRDLLQRVAALFDGAFAAKDTLYEDILAYELNDRFDVDIWYHDMPYRDIINSFYRETPRESAADLERYVKNWYLAMQDAPWHDSHLRMSKAGGGYFGYWAVEAGAAAYLLDIDDRPFREHLVYPKDLVDFAKTMDAAVESSSVGSEDLTHLRVKGGQPCPQAGYWTTPAQLDSRRLFKAGEIMPTFEHSAYGATIWQWSEEQ